MENDLYKQNFKQRINQIYDDGFSNISNIETFPLYKAQDILKEILETGCKCQNFRNISLAREMILKIPEHWLLIHLPNVVKNDMFLEQGWEEWEYRRMAEMLQESFPSVFKWLIDYVKQLKNPDIEEATQDYI